MKYRPHLRLPIAILACLMGLTACSGYPPKTLYRTSPDASQTYDYEDGWRMGTVKQVGSAQSLPDAHHWDCRNQLPAPEAWPTYARVQFKRDQLRIDRVVPVREGAPLAPGQQVLVHIRSCQAPTLVVNQAP